MRQLRAIWGRVKFAVVGLVYLARFPVLVALLIMVMQGLKSLVHTVDKVPDGIDWWLTQEKGPARLKHQPELLDWCPHNEMCGPDPTPYWETTTPTPPAHSPTEIINIDPEVRFQEVLGIGTSLEHSTAFNMARLKSENYTRVVKSLFDIEAGIGFNLARVTIGSSDFAPKPFYTYDDLDDPHGRDPELAHFSIGGDEGMVLPLVRAALDASRGWYAGDSDSLLLFASSWSPPAWMKNSGRIEGGSLLPEHRKTYARYLLRYLKEYAKQGISIFALTPQNEPLADKDSYPTTLMSPQEEAEVIAELGPLLESSGMGTRIWCFDHNYNAWWYAQQVLKDPKAAGFVEGVAFHHYEGNPQDVEDMAKLHGMFPGKRIVFSEGSAFGIKGADEIVQIFRNFATTYMAWVTMLDKDLKPNSGPFVANMPMLTLNLSDPQGVTYNTDYYFYGQFAKFIRRGARRISSTSNGTTTDISHVAFENSPYAAGVGNRRAFVVVVVNQLDDPRYLRLRFKGRITKELKLPGRSVATFRWRLPVSLARSRLLQSPLLLWLTLLPAVLAAWPRATVGG